MHIPDGLMWPIVMAVGWLIAVPVISIAIRRAGRELTNEKIPTMGVLAAGLFVAQMINFPIIGGTSGHLIGATLATLMVGPWCAIVAMTVVIVIQGILFGDGGILSMGLNLLNMAVAAVLVSTASIRITKRLSIGTSSLIAAWLSVFAAAAMCALELSVSYLAEPGTYGIGWNISFPVMLGLYAVIAVGEAAITGSVVAYFLKVAPQNIRSVRKSQEAAS